MDFRERAAIRIRHWLEHNESHWKEYQEFAAQLEESEAGGCAAHVREMAELTRKSSECLRKALAALEERERGRC